jgi:FkbM family methyltransferase
MEPRRLELTLGQVARWWIVHAPTSRGQSFIMRSVFPRLRPEAADFTVRAPGGGRIRARLTESTGWELLHGRDVERAESVWGVGRVQPGDAVIDAGANVGLFSVPVALAIGDTGRVIAFEPVAETAARLRASLRLNRLTNVTVCEAAVGDARGTVELRVAQDSAYSGLSEDERSPTIARRSIPMVTIDGEWTRLGKPPVTLVKLDVEGSEIRALHGAQALIDACRPVILAEAAGEAEYAALVEWFGRRSYRVATPPGFRPYNHVFEFHRA